MAKNKEKDEDKGEEALDSEDEVSNKGKKKLLFIIIGAVVLLLAAAGGAFFFMSGGEEAPAEEAAPAAESEHGEAPVEGEHGEAAAEGGHGAAPTASKGPKVPVYYDIPEFLVDLNTADKRKSSFLKMKVAVELSSQEDVATLEAYMPRVRDNFITYLRELRASDLSGSAGLYRLREELLLRINQAIAPATVNNILFKEIIVQ